MYGSNKVATLPVVVHALQTNAFVHPQHILLSLSDLCNHDCPWCSFRASHLPATKMFAENGKANPNRMIEDVQHVVNEIYLAQAIAVTLTGGGEPTLHPEFSSVVAFLKASGVAVGVITNGSRIGHVIGALGNVDWIRISLDAGTLRMHAKVHNVQNQWESICDGMRMLKRRDIEFGCSFVVQGANVSDIYDAAVKAKYCGASSIRYTAVIGEEPSWEEEALTEIALARSVETVDFQVIDQFTSRRRRFNPTLKRCYQQQLSPFIGADLNVYRCCNTAYTKAGLLGSLKTSSLIGIMRDHHARMLEFDGRQCHGCVYVDRNLATEGLVHPSVHDKFI